MDLSAPPTADLLTLALTPGVGQTSLHKLLRHFGHAADVLRASEADLTQIEGVGKGTAHKFHNGFVKSQTEKVADAELSALREHDAWLLDFDEPGFPAALKMIPDPPRLLWGRGALEANDTLALAIVGSRECTPYGREQAARFANACADAGLTIVSGGAYGIDAAAHEAVLKAHELGSPARTISVIGSGLAKPYPAPHRKLFDRIVDAGSAVISELPMHTPPRATQFPARNRIIAGLSLGVLVIEAAKRSGALITARLAVEEHGRECMALPGRADSPASAGCHELIRKGGATLVTHPDHVLEQLGDAGSTLQAARDLQQKNRKTSKKTQAGAEEQHNEAPDSPANLFESNLTEPQQHIVAAADAPRTFDELLAATALPVGQLRTELTMLELRGALQRDGSRYVRRG